LLCGWDLEPAVESGYNRFAGAFDARATDCASAGIHYDSADIGLIRAKKACSKQKLAGEQQKTTHETSPFGTYHSSSQKPVS
jgi:hypothetical protein